MAKVINLNAYRHEKMKKPTIFANFTARYIYTPISIRIAQALNIRLGDAVVVKLSKPHHDKFTINVVYVFSEKYPKTIIAVPRKSLKDVRTLNKNEREMYVDLL